MQLKWGLAVLMAKKNVKNKDLIEATGFTATTISKLKNLEWMPERLERKTLEKLCDALDCEPGDLIYREPEPFPSPPLASKQHTSRKGKETRFSKTSSRTETQTTKSKREETWDDFYNLLAASPEDYPEDQSIKPPSKVREFTN